MAGVTLDAGAFIGLERGDRRTIAHLKEAQGRGLDVTVPTVVVAEVWRGGSRSAGLARLLAACIVEPLSQATARAAGEAQAAVRAATTIDAVVMASASARGDRVLTSDPSDLARLQRVFTNVRVTAV